MKTKYEKLKEQHQQLSAEVDKLTNQQLLSSTEEKQLAVLKKLKLAYKDARKNSGK